VEAPVDLHPIENVVSVRVWLVLISFKNAVAIEIFHMSFNR